MDSWGQKGSGMLEPRGEGALGMYCLAIWSNSLGSKNNMEWPLRVLVGTSRPGLDQAGKNLACQSFTL